jgi:zinc protease
MCASGTRPGTVRTTPILVLAGDIDVAEARELVGKYFGGIAPGAPTTRLSAWVPTLDANIRDRMQDRVPQARIYRIWHVPGAGERAAHALELYADLLAGSDSAPLQRALVFDQKLATDVGAFVSTNQLSGQLMVYASVKPGSDVAATEAALDAVIAASLEQPPRPMRWRAPACARSRRWCADWNAWAPAQACWPRARPRWDAPTVISIAWRICRRSTPARSASLRREWLSRHHYTMVVEPFPTLAAKTGDLDRKLLPPLAPPPALAFPEVQRERLANGLDLVLMRRPSVPVVRWR